MMKAQISGNAVELSLPAGEALSLGISAAMVGVLLLVAGWQVAFVALGLSVGGAVAVDWVQQAGVKIPGR